ncbi:hypothetical protein HCDSEM_153 [Candidatus Hodgkinia cicadicola Dsem]|nr:hypothetical protein HCDSEM_153 [Candidatus Hodgkinia cicadicola Dsem]
MLSLGLNAGTSRKASNVSDDCLVYGFDLCSRHLRSLPPEAALLGCCRFACSRRAARPPLLLV